VMLPAGGEGSCPRLRRIRPLGRSGRGAAVLGGTLAPGCAVPGACLTHPGPDLGPTWAGPRPYAGAPARAPARGAPARTPARGAPARTPARGAPARTPARGALARGALCGAVSACHGRGGCVSVLARVRSCTGRTVAHGGALMG